MNSQNCDFNNFSCVKSDFSQSSQKSKAQHQNVGLKNKS